MTPPAEFKHLCLPQDHAPNTQTNGEAGRLEGSGASSEARQPAGKDAADVRAVRLPRCRVPRGRLLGVWCALQPICARMAHRLAAHATGRSETLSSKSHSCTHDKHPPALRLEAMRRNSATMHVIALAHSFPIPSLHSRRSRYYHASAPASRCSARTVLWPQAHSHCSAGLGSGSDRALPARRRCCCAGRRRRESGWARRRSR